MKSCDYNEIIETYYDLVDMCNEYGAYDIISNIYDEDQYKERIDEIINDMLSDSYWYTIRDYLNNLPEGADYYEETMEGFISLYDGDQTFISLKEDLHEYMINNNLFDDCEELANVTDDEVVNDEEKLFIESVSNTTTEEIFGLFTDCNKYYTTI